MALKLRFFNFEHLKRHYNLGFYSINFIIFINKSLFNK